jgi:hypothetical protein
MRWDALKSGRPTGVAFWYRQSRVPMTSMTYKANLPGTVLPDDPENTQPGMLSMRIDSSGRLLQFKAVPMPPDSSGTTRDAPDWAQVFAESALPMATFSLAVPQRAAVDSGETRAAWEGVNPDRPQMALRVEASAANGRIVFFDAFPPAVRAVQGPSGSVPTDRGFDVIVAYSTLLIWGGAALLAWRNARQGRGDQRGARRLSLFTGGTALIGCTIGAHHVASFVQEMALMQLLLAFALVIAAAVWIMYIAIEPYLRRVWPEVLIGWSRVLAGKFFDPLVGRDVLVGVCVGTLTSLTTQVFGLAQRWIGLPPPIVGASVPGLPPNQLAVSARHGLESVILAVAMETFVALSLTGLLVFFRFLLRSRAAAALGVIVVLTAETLVLLAPPPGIGALGWAVAVVIIGVAAAAMVFVLVRLGTLSMIAAFFAFTLTTLVPITFDWSAPYAETSWIIVGTILALTIYGFRTTRGGRPVALSRFEPQV